jgi:hypothetical protein
VQKGGSISQLGNLLSQGRITQEMYDDALAQIHANDAKIKAITDQHQVALDAWKQDLKDWHLANGVPYVQLNGMTEGVLIQDRHAARAWLATNQKPGDLGPSGKLSPNAVSAVNAQKDSNISNGDGNLRQLGIDSLNPDVINGMWNKNTVKGMDLAMQQTSPLTETIRVTRTFNPGAFKDPDTKLKFNHDADISHIVGSIQSDWGFAETSYGSIAAGDAPGYNQGNVVMDLVVPAGITGIFTNAPGYSFNNNHPGERGFILERGVHYYIHSVEKRTDIPGASEYNPKWYVQAEIIPKELYDEYGHFQNENPFFD